MYCHKCGTEAVAETKFCSNCGIPLIQEASTLPAPSSKAPFPPSASKESLMSKALGIGTWIMGTAIGLYSGINLLIPLFATGAVWWATSKFLKDDKKVIVPAFSVNAGHSLWLSLALLLVGAHAFANVGSDLIVYFVGLVWLLKKPSLGPLYLLGIFQLASLGINGYALTEAAVGSAQHKALLVHVIWRALALFLMLKLFLILKKKPKTDFAAAP